jgi:hypothetical protein
MADRTTPSVQDEAFIEREEFEKSTASESLHSSDLLPIIIVMKIWFRIGAEQERPPERCWRVADPLI